MTYVCTYIMLRIYYDNITFAEIVQGLYQSLIQCGYVCEVVNTVGKDHHTSVYIMFGMNDYAGTVPLNYIVYQLEQTTCHEESKWFTERYINFLKGAIEVWEYSLVNLQFLRGKGIEKIRYVPLQFMEVDTRVDTKVNKTIDFLFFGSLNERRRLILNRLQEAGLKVVVKENLWKDEREQLITQSKYIINLHYYQNSILETARLSHLLGKGCLVVSERSQDPILDRWHQKYLIFLEKEKDIVDQFRQVLSGYETHYKTLSETLKEYYAHPYRENIPFDTLKNFQCFITLGSVETPTTQMTAPVSPITDNHDIFEAEQEITKNRELVLKLPRLQPSDLPSVSIVTVTYNRKKVFPMAIRNWKRFEYPAEKMEWIIVDDSEDGSNLHGLLPKDQRIYYYRLQTTGRLSIGQKRNYGVQKANHEYILFMDDDDYYYPLSIYARIALLLKYPQYDLVGVTDLDIYDVVNDFSARVKGSLISEASMAFKKSFWRECPFPDEFNSLGEGYPFTKDRRNRIIRMPSCFNMIAMTHRTNYTQGGRSYDRFKDKATRGDNLLNTLDVETRLFIIDLFGQAR
jgi:hypothetical protein